jgi:hypothetical protein
MRSCVYLAAEDEVTLALGRRILGECPPLSIYREYNAGGFGRLRKRVVNFQRMAQLGFPTLLLTDLDRAACPAQLIGQWFSAAPATGFLFRVCVRNGESWVMADREAFAAFMHIAVAQVPREPEKSSDPKGELVRLAQRAPRRIREALTPIKSATIGPGHNSLLSGFVRDSWSPKRAAQNSASLTRCLARVRALADLCRKSA